MKKSILFIFLSLFFVSLFSQDFDTEDSFDAGFDSDETEETDSSEESDDSDDFDDFDLIFAGAEDVEEPVVEEAAQPATPVQIVASAFSSMVHFSGQFTGDVGLAYVRNKADDVDGKEDKPSGYFSLGNTLNMTVSPSYIFMLHGSFVTGISNGFTIGVSSLYFDYLLLNRLYITAGKTSVSWGNLRLFNSDYYGVAVHSGGLYGTGPTKRADIFAEDGAQLALILRYPWSFGTITFATTGNKVSGLQIDDFNYYGSIEFSVLNTNFNFYAKRPEKASGGGNPETTKKNLFGLEVKRTILGFDTYAQGIARVKDYKNLHHSTGYQYIIATAGIYRLFDAFDPNIGFNIEYQHEFDPSLEKPHIDRLAFEGGLKRIGPAKNMKIGIISHYNITEKHGFSGLNYIISGILPYAEWTNKFAIGYGEKYQQGVVFMLSSSIALSLDY